MISSDLGIGVDHEVHTAAGEEFESEVAAAFGPFVGLLGQDGADESDDGLAVGAPLSSSGGC